MMTILDECFDSNTPIANKRLLHSSLSQSPSLTPSIQRDATKCLTSLKFVEEGQFVLVGKNTLDSVEKKELTIAEQKQQLDVQGMKLSESERKNAQLEGEKAEWMEERKTHVSMNLSLQKENEQLRSDMGNKTKKLEEKERCLIQAQDTLQHMKNEVARKEQFYISSEIIVAFSPAHVRVNGSTVTRINSDSWAGCFMKPVSKGIHRLSINNPRTNGITIGVLDTAEYPKYLVSNGMRRSPKAAVMHNGGDVVSADKWNIRNTPPREGQEWSAEADLEKRTLHFFVDGVQQPHHFINVPVPLVFAVDIYYKDTQIEITYWGEEKRSHVTFQGTGRNLG
ncbi:hypothetical protein BLNAU_11837 [Blattamonas nauphoetae]|uniref:Uncharacterized protein n=1 Tax=Blattamonas nauphoetae TaxID=2049346 RepID=A0ABQ9XLA2_9EUKA|nr:hypothetical protein BLNAU_11837 [Blattamonas nauphoetae]